MKDNIYKKALDEWVEKTDFIQELVSKDSLHCYLGMHRADVAKDLIFKLKYKSSLLGESVDVLINSLKYIVWLESQVDILKAAPPSFMYSKEQIRGILNIYNKECINVEP